MVRKRDGEKDPERGKDTALSFARTAPIPIRSNLPEGVKALYQEAKREVAHVVEAVRAAKPFEVGAVQRTTVRLIESLTQGDWLLALALEGGETYLDLAGHSVNVAIFSIKIGLTIGYGEEDLWRLALAACLHDLGMMSIPPHVLKKPGTLTAEELTLIRRHPEKSRSMLQALGAEFDWLATVASHEHEREDGSGYPQGLKGDQIHEYAKIVGLADVYESLTHARPYRGMLVQYDLQQIARDQSGAFPDRIVRAMIQALSPSPSNRAGAPTGVKDTAGASPKGRPGSSAPPVDVKALYQGTRQAIARLVEALGAGESADLGALQAGIASLVKMLGQHENELLVQVLEGKETHFDLAGHMLNVAILAIKIGQGVGYGEEELQRLALAACLHDVGAVSVPHQLLEKSDDLTPDELAIMRQHPEKGFRMLQTLGPEFNWLALVALHEQEREDGSGYPQGLKGDQISEYAKITGLADVYESLTHGRVNQKRRVPFDAVKEIVGVNRHMFPHRMLKGLIQGLSTFPLGSLVQLNSKEIARVVATNPASPLRPVVEVLTDPRGDRLDPTRRVDLSQNSLLYITGASPMEAEAGPS